MASYVVVQDIKYTVSVNENTETVAVSETRNNLSIGVAQGPQGPTSLEFEEVTSTTVTAEGGKGYITNNANIVTVTLPSTAKVGQLISIVGKGIGGWQLSQNAGQTIHKGSTSTTPGVTGSIASTNRRDAIELVCTVENLEFTVRNFVGTLVVV